MSGDPAVVAALRTDRAASLSEVWAAVAGMLEMLPPLDETLRQYGFDRSGRLGALMHREDMLGPATMSALALIRLMSAVAACVPGYDPQVLRHLPTVSAADKASLLPDFAVQKTLTVTFGPTPILVTGMGDWRLSAGELRELARALGLPRGVRRHVHINPRDGGAEAAFGVLPGMVTPFLRPGPVSVEAVVRMEGPATDVPQRSAAISVSPFESLVVPAHALAAIVERYLAVVAPQLPTLVWDPAPC